MYSYNIKLKYIGPSDYILSILRSKNIHIVGVRVLKYDIIILSNIEIKKQELNNLKILINKQLKNYEK